MTEGADAASVSKGPGLTGVRDCEILCKRGPIRSSQLRSKALPRGLGLKRGCSGGRGDAPGVGGSALCTREGAFQPDHVADSGKALFFWDILQFVFFFI